MFHVPRLGWQCFKKNCGPGNSNLHSDFGTRIFGLQVQQSILDKMLRIPVPQLRPKLSKYPIKEKREVRLLLP